MFWIWGGLNFQILAHCVFIEVIQGFGGTVVRVSWISVSWGFRVSGHRIKRNSTPRWRGERACLSAPPGFRVQGSATFSPRFLSSTLLSFLFWGLLIKTE